MQRFAQLRLGEQKQQIDADIDMLSADFAITSTSSSVGTRFAEIFSNSYGTLRDSYLRAVIVAILIVPM